MKTCKKLLFLIPMLLALAVVVPVTTEAATIKLSEKSVTIIKGQKKKLTLKNAKGTIKWTSSKKKVATVDKKGTVTGKAKGTTYISAKFKGKSYKCKVKVETPKISKTKLTLGIGKTATLKVNGTTLKTSWKSSNPRVATVSKKGQIKGVKKGTCKVTATVGGKKYTCNVTVGGSLSIKRTRIYNGNDVSIYATGVNETVDLFEIGIYIENNSKLNLGFNARAYSVNGVMTGNNIYSMRCDVGTGKKANAVLEVKKDFLKEKSIKQLEYIDVLIWAYDKAESYKSFDTGQLRIKTSAYRGERKDYVKGKTVYNKGGIKVAYIKSNGDEYTFAVTNNTGIYMDYDVENVSINDFTTSDLDFDLMGVITLNACQSEFTIKIDDDFKAQNSIPKAKKIEFTLNVRPEEDYFKEYDTDVIRGL